EAIAAAGPGGNFLTQKHTRKHMRDLFLPEFMDRRPYTEWEAGKDNAPDWALAKARRILAAHQPEPLSQAIGAEMDRIIASLEKIQA
ncbi:MAG: trimethylamine methyltransferase family protein, partial [Bacteroidota bacterium]